MPASPVLALVIWLRCGARQQLPLLAGALSRDGPEGGDIYLDRKIYLT
jgi:hypothetical protein